MPKQWKRARFTHPQVVRGDKLCPVSLTDCFAKSVRLISKMLLNDVSNNIDIQQLGNVHGVATTHYMYLYLAC